MVKRRKKGKRRKKKEKKEEKKKGKIIRPCISSAIFRVLIESMSPICQVVIEVNKRQIHYCNFVT